MTTSAQALATGALWLSEWTLPELASLLGGTLDRTVPAGTHPGTVSTDTRSLAPGALFVALSGPSFDGHAFLEAAAAKGATGALVARGRAQADIALPQIEVLDPLAALHQLAHAIWQRATSQGLHTVALTGSNGKTTTKEILAALWSTVGITHATHGNLNNHIGVPLTLCALPRDARHLVVEMGANQPGDIAELIALAPGTARIITSIGEAHLEGLGSLDGVRRTKAEIFQGAGPQTAAIVPWEEAARLVAAEFPGHIWTVGEGPGARVRVATGPALCEQGRAAQTVDVQVDSRSWKLAFPLSGSHNARNLGAALATMLAQGLVPEATQLNAALATLRLPQGRWREVLVGSWHVVDDAYNANPSSMRATLSTFADYLPAGAPAGEVRRVVVLGTMLELGSEARRLHEDVARHGAGLPGIAALVGVGEFGAAMAAAALERRPDLDVLAARDTEEAARFLVGRPGAIVLLKASRGSRLERVIDHLLACPST